MTGADRKCFSKQHGMELNHFYSIGNGLRHGEMTPAFIKLL